MAALERLPVKGRAPMTGYDRDRFGPAWLDADRNGCDTRSDVLAAHLTHVVLEPGTHDCVVTSGDLADPYTGSTIHFVRGDGTLVDIDHVVALGNAWATGAFREPIRQRAALANDPLNLLPVDASANRQKGDGDAATWLPANKAYRCRYVARQVAVKTKYDLWVTPPERAAIERVLEPAPGSGCRRTPAHPCSRPCGSPNLPHLLPHPLPPPARTPSRAATRPGPPVRRRCTGVTPATPRSWMATATASPASEDAAVSLPRPRSRCSYVASGRLILVGAVGRSSGSGVPR